MTACICGSGLPRTEHKDARGIFLFFACAHCEDIKRSGIRPEVLSNPAYEADEPIEPEDVYDLFDDGEDW